MDIEPGRFAVVADPTGAMFNVIAIKPGVGGRARPSVALVARPRGAKARAAVVIERLAQEYPDAECALVHDDAFQLLAATILSAQTTDENVNKVTPELFAKYPTPRDLADADPGRRRERSSTPPASSVRRRRTSSGWRASSTRTSAARCPTELDDLVKLPGVGRKTGNVVRSVAFDLPGLPVDTHVGRLSRRLKLTNETDPVKAELDLNALVPPEERGRFSLRLILHGRRVCFAAEAQLRGLRPGRHLPVRLHDRPLMTNRRQHQGLFGVC